MKIGRFFFVWVYIKSVHQCLHNNPLQLFLVVILDAILDFLARTEINHCILADS